MTFSGFGHQPSPPGTGGPTWLDPAPYARVPRRHPWEIPLLVLVGLVTLAAYVLAVILLANGVISEYFILPLVMPVVLYFARGLNYAKPRTQGVQMSPTQFPEGYQMVAESARRYGLEFIPDAYVILGNGTINAYASGHGFRRFVVVTSDLFEVGGAARDPDALRFIIGHEVGHIAAGHTSYWRQVISSIGMSLPLLGSALSRSQEYTADNFGYYTQPSGSPLVIGVLSAGKYMLRSVSFDQMADRATSEKGFFVWVTNLMASHPVNTWRAAALRNRTRAGNLFFRPSRFDRGVGSGHVTPVTRPDGLPPFSSEKLMGQATYPQASAQAPYPSAQYYPYPNQPPNLPPQQHNPDAGTGPHPSEPPQSEPPSGEPGKS